MQPRSEIVSVLCLTAVLLCGCACGVPKRGDGALENRAFATRASAPLAQGLTSGAQPEEVGRRARAAVFRDYGRYYK